MIDKREQDLQRDYTPRCGDTVLHGPTGESWVVAYADPRRDELAYAGWPPALAKLSDCLVTERCSDEQHEQAVREWADAPEYHREGGQREHNWRRARVLERFGHVLPQAGPG